MITKLFKRLAILGVAFLVTCISDLEIARAYLYVDLAWVAIVVGVFVAIIAIGGALIEETAIAGLLNFFVILIMAFAVVVNLLISFVLSRLLNFDFYMTYLVIDFVMCLIPSKKNE